MIKFKRKKFSNKPIPFIKLLPNIVTLLGLIIGMNSIRFALEQRWEEAVYCVLIATIIDGIDGRVARFLNATSSFGAELDSLCDFVNFGVCPALIIYFWSANEDAIFFSWSISMLLIICMALRLARFNITISNNDFFQGIPAPIGALLVLMPIILNFRVFPYYGIDNIREYISIINLYMVIISLLVASSIPTVSLKNIKIKREYLSLSMMLSSSVIITMYIYTWYFLPILAIIYLLSTPYCIYVFRTNRLIKDDSNSEKDNILP